MQSKCNTCPLYSRFYQQLTGSLPYHKSCLQREGHFANKCPKKGERNPDKKDKSLTVHGASMEAELDAMMKEKCKQQMEYLSNLKYSEIAH